MPDKIQNMSHREIIQNSIDWVSVKLNMVCLIGFTAKSDIIWGLTILATLTTIIYNSIRIYREFHKLKPRS
jgi:hypothetical protein